MRLIGKAAVGRKPRIVGLGVVRHHSRKEFFVAGEEGEFTLRAAAVRLADLEAGRNPSDPYADIEELQSISDIL